MKNVKDFPELDRKLKAEQYDAMVNYCIGKGIKNAFIQDGSSASESFIPDFMTSN